MEIKFRLLDESAKIPTRKFADDAGLDIYSNELTIVGAGAQVVIRTGVQLVGAPTDCVLFIWSKSGIAAKFNVHVGAGVVDPNYRGEILVLLRNMSDERFYIRKGDPIAQLVIVPCLRPHVITVLESSDSERGDSGGIVSSKYIYNKLNVHITEEEI